jgi:Predicted dehydrogenases and related proteins
MSLKAAVIGINWGQVHIHALRSLGVEVVGICATHQERLAQVAREQQISFTSTTPELLLDLPLDLITIATPANSHANLLTQCKALPVICEKPLVGMEGAEPELDALPEKLWINYAFAFLDSARAIQRLRPALGKIHRLEMHCLYDLPLAFSPAQWWLEVASHPLSFLIHLFGEPSTTCQRTAESVELQIGGIPTTLSCQASQGLQGIRQHLRIHSDSGVVELSGEFRQGHPWRYAPLTLAGKALNAGEWSDNDCWIRANVRSFEAILRQIKGTTPLVEGLAEGVFNPAKSWPIDRLIRTAFAEPGSDLQT